MPVPLAVALAGALGALARYGLDGLIARRAPGAFPWGTFAINVSGSLVLGLLFTVFTERLAVDAWIRSGITIGFLGAYTTFSTWMLESHRLAEEGEDGMAVANLALSLGVGLGAVALGRQLGRLL